jgi:hypothetical protein
MPGLGEAVAELLDGLQVAAGTQGGQDPLAELGQGIRRRLQVLLVVGGQDLHAVGQGRAEGGRVGGVDPAADAGGALLVFDGHRIKSLREYWASEVVELAPVEAQDHGTRR